MLFRSQRLETEAQNMFQYFSNNKLIANPAKTAFIMFAPQKRIKGHKYSIKLDPQTVIMESDNERILGIEVQNTLEPEAHLNKLKEKVNYGLGKLKRLQNQMRTKHLKMIGQGTIMSNINYGIQLYMASKVRLCKEEPLKEELRSLQVKMNEMLRIILNIKRKDKRSVDYMLKKCDLLSINQLACKSILLELWKARNFNIEGIMKNFKYRDIPRFKDLFRTSKDPKSFVSVASKLWEKSSKRFRDTNLISVAKKEAEKLAKTLPI